MPREIATQTPENIMYGVVRYYLKQFFLIQSLEKQKRGKHEINTNNYSKSFRRGGTKDGFVA